MGREEVVTPDVVTAERQESVLILTIDSPPTAALSASVRSSLMQALTQADEDAEVASIVITGTNGNFATGAGLAEDALAHRGFFDEQVLAVMLDDSSNCQIGWIHSLPQSGCRQMPSWRNSTSTSLAAQISSNILP